MPVREGTTGRALMSLTLDTARSMREREQRDREMGLGELLQEFQVEINGTATTTWGFAETTISFDAPFHYAPGQRDPDFDVPHFWYGAELFGPMVAITAAVTGWRRDDNTGAVIGATVTVGACADTDGVVWTGMLHLTFQGFSALAEGEAAADVGD